MADNAIAIDRFQLNRDLKDVGEYLAELRYIDLAEPYIVERNREIAASGVPIGHNYVQVQLGTQFPFTSQSILLPDTASTEIELRAFDTLAGQASQWAAGEMDFLVHLIRGIMHYPTEGYGPMDGSLDGVRETLETEAQENFGYLGDEIADWEGTAASEFKSLFYNKYGDARDNQMYLVGALRGALEASRRIIEFSQQSVINGVTEAREALLDQLRLRAAGDDISGSARVALMVLAGAATVLGAVVEAPLWAAATVASVEFGAGAAAEAIPTELAEDRDIKGASAEELHVSLLDAIRDVDAFLGRELDYLHDELRSLRGTVRSLHDEHLILPKRPRLAEGVGGEEFYHTSSEQYP
jgi:hypothetical protein